APPARPHPPVQWTWVGGHPWGLPTKRAAPHIQEGESSRRLGRQVGGDEEHPHIPGERTASPHPATLALSTRRPDPSPPNRRSCPCRASAAVQDRAWSQGAMRMKEAYEMDGL